MKRTELVRHHWSNNPDQHVVCFGCVNRRAILEGIVGIGVGLEIGPARAQDNPTLIAPQKGDLLVPAYSESTIPLTVGDSAIGGPPIEAYAMDAATKTIRNGTPLNLLTLVRFDLGELTLAAREIAADGVLAYSIICTHAACEVNEWPPNVQLLQCPCHFSQFNPRDKAAVVQGPATRSLPVLRLRSSNGILAVAAPFDARVGGDVDA